MARGVIEYTCVFRSAHGANGRLIKPHLAGWTGCSGGSYGKKDYLPQKNAAAGGTAGRTVGRGARRPVPAGNGAWDSHRAGVFRGGVYPWNRGPRRRADSLAGGADQPFEQRLGGGVRRVYPLRGPRRAVAGGRNDPGGQRPLSAHELRPGTEAAALHAAGAPPDSGL